MDFGNRRIDFEEADRRYAGLQQRHDAGAISDGEFEAQLKRLMVQDEGGRWWARSRSTGDWHFHDGASWVKGAPPPPR